MSPPARPSLPAVAVEGGGTVVPSSRLRVLVCDDDPQMRRALAAVLRDAGFAVEATATTADALDRARRRPPDGAIVAAKPAGADGVALCRRLREWSAMPLIVVAAVADEDELVRALQAGADHYLAAPLAPRELVARLNATLRRAATPGPSPRHRVGDLVIDLAARAVRGPEGPVHLTPIEFGLLRALVLARGRALTHRALLEQVWGPAFVPDARVLRSHMVNLRRKIEPADGRRHIGTQHGVGYRLANETRRSDERTIAPAVRLIPREQPASTATTARRHAA
jgi:two-component system KDP operon response regulator KdpE